jgi:hypothetical protein
LNILWVPFVAFLDIAVPDKILTLPIAASFLVSLAHAWSLYELRVRVPKTQLFASLLAAMSVQWTVARAVGMGLVKDHLPFVRTDKGGAKRKTEFPAFWEGIIAALLLIGAMTLVGTNIKQVREINLFALVLCVQSLPFIAAVLLAWLERSRLNDFATWRRVQSRTLALLPKREARKKSREVA